MGTEDRPYWEDVRGPRHLGGHLSSCRTEVLGGQRHPVVCVVMPQKPGLLALNTNHVASSFFSVVMRHGNALYPATLLEKMLSG